MQSDKTIFQQLQFDADKKQFPDPGNLPSGSANAPLDTCYEYFASRTPMFSDYSIPDGSTEF